jgi:hypothetical protein
MANGRERPTINKNAGKTVYVNPRPSAPVAACFIHSGIFLTLSTSFTKIINNMVMARNTSIDCKRFGN